MTEPSQNPNFGIRTVVYGHTGKGSPLQEYQWGNKEKSILFLSGFNCDDRPVSELLIRWFGMLEEGLRQGGVLGDFDLKHLKNRCRIRLIPQLDPDSAKINRNGLYKNGKIIEKNEISTESTVNFRGVNLNRNFNANWVKMKKENPMRADCGLFPESEAEVASFAKRVKQDLPVSAVILRYGQNALFYPKEATQKELKEAFFLGQYGGFATGKATDTDGTALQWLTDRGIKTVEVFFSQEQLSKWVKTRDFLTMCAALT